MQTPNQRQDSLSSSFLRYTSSQNRLSMALQDASQFKYPQIVTCNGYVIAFASRTLSGSQPQIGYSVLMQQTQGASDVIWKDFEPLDFATELRPVGFRLVSLEMGSGGPAVPDVAFQVCADDTYVYVFRQSNNGSIYMDRFYFDDTAIRLCKISEVRFRRSRDPDIPLDRKDTFGTQDMNQQTFVEPTLDLCFLAEVNNGWFQIAILPTDLPSVTRWHILQCNVSGDLTVYSIARSDDGLFDLSDSIDAQTGTVAPSQLFQLVDTTGATLPPSAGPSLVLYNRQERLMDEYGRYTLQKRALRCLQAIPVGANGQIALIDNGIGQDGRCAQVPEQLTVPALPPSITGLGFSPSCDYSVLMPDLIADTDAFTLEFWLQVTSADGTLFVLQSRGSSQPGCVALQDGVPVFMVEQKLALAADTALLPGYWYHLALSFDGTSGGAIHINGQPGASTCDPLSQPDPPDTGWMIGGPNGFDGILNEIRMWRVVRTTAEIIDTMNRPIASDNPAWPTLAGYWPCNEPEDDKRFSTLLNQASNGSAGDGILSGASWVISDAPRQPSLQPVAWDNNGLSTCCGLLASAQTHAAPDIVDGGDGMLHLYYTDTASGAMQAALLSTVGACSEYSVSWLAGDPAKPDDIESGVITFVARHPGSWMNAPATMQCILIEPNAKDSELATVTLTCPAGRSEIWPDVPRSANIFVAILNGDAVQKGSADTDASIIYDYLSVKVTENGIMHGQQPASGIGSSIFSVSPLDNPGNGYTAVVQAAGSGTDQVLRVMSGSDQRWLAYPPLLTVDNRELGSYIRVYDSEKVDLYQGALAASGDVTIEAWVAPTDSQQPEPSTVWIFNKHIGQNADIRYALLFNQQGQVIAAKDDVVRISKSSLSMDGQWSHIAASYATDYGLQLAGTRYLNAGNDRSLNSSDALTLEAWVRLDHLGTQQCILSKSSRTEDNSWSFYVSPDGKLNFRVNQSTATVQVQKTIQSTSALMEGIWHHVAAIYDVSSKPQTAAKFNGNKTYISLPMVENPPMTEVSVMMWIRSDGNFRTSTQMLFQSIDPAQQLVVILTLNNGCPTFKCIINSQVFSVKSKRTLRPNNWIHVAGVYSAAGIDIFIDGQSVADGAGTQAFTSSELMQQAVTPDKPGAFLIGNNAASDQGFVGTINEISLWNRRLSLDEVRQKIQQPLAASEKGLSGYWPCQDMYGTSVMDLVGAASGTLFDGSFVRIEKGAFAQKILLDGQLEAFERVTDPIVVSDAALTLGSGDHEYYLQGAFDDLRLWNQGRMNWQIEYFRARRLEDNAQGLVSEWDFLTGKGRVAFDSKSQNNASIRDASLQLSDAAADLMWIKTTFKAGWTLLINGVTVALDIAAFDPVIYGDTQATIGATRKDGALFNNLTGRLNEVRIWNSQRTPGQIRNYMNVPIAPNAAGLAGYWPISDGSGHTVGDATGMGSNGRWIGPVGTVPWMLSDAPVSIDLADIGISNGGRAPLKPLKSHFACGACAYGDMQTDAYGNLLAVYQRAYAVLPQNQSLELAANLAIGDLDLQFVGQVQTDPNLIGYIEGPPPLPAENLKLYPGTPNAYNNASTLTLNESAGINYNYTASRDTGFDMNVNTSLGFRWEEEIDAGGLVVSTLLFGFISNIGISSTFTNSLGWLNEGALNSDALQFRVKQVEARGAWQKNVYKIDNGVGQLFYPDNMGYALVLSGTADMYALRLRGTGALVTYSLRPSPDIPQDINIIMFKLAPGYVKNGTLDGWIGFEPDKNYANLTPGEHGSYFKPLEAYALKQQIDREHAQSTREFDNFDAGSIGRRTNAINFQPGDIGDANNDIANILMGISERKAISSQEWLRRRGRRNMVNSYVWTAQGGLYTEEEQFTVSRQMVSGGSYSFSGMAGPTFSTTFRKGGYFELDAMFGGHIVTHASKSATEHAGFQMNLTANGESYIGTINGSDDDLEYTDIPSPGKVKQYRFMSFYLAPTKRNFEDFKAIVDQEWLHRTGAYAHTVDPDAAALQQAMFRPNEVWRVLHRVTYVARVPLNQQSALSQPQNARRPDAASLEANSWLINQLQTSSTANPMPGVSRRADVLLDTLATNPVWGAKVAAKRSELKQNFMTYMRACYEIPN
ncbi:LamG-like jellyroll fold domain-containing protein [Serratia grimesii]|uniref:LamG-like jellyroll fold domain-containing protein n=1 Tax=Serratia grimesii TaxID=82995 RepID=UPI003839F5BF